MGNIQIRLVLILLIVGIVLVFMSGCTPLMDIVNHIKEAHVLTDETVITSQTLTLASSDQVVLWQYQFS